MGCPKPTPFLNAGFFWDDGLVYPQQTQIAALLLASKVVLSLFGLVEKAIVIALGVWSTRNIAENVVQQYLGHHLPSNEDDNKMILE